MIYEHFVLQPNDWIPNNPKLPVILYRGALPPRGVEDAAFGFEQMLNETDGLLNGATGYSTTITIIPRRMRCWASPPVKRALC